MQPPPLPDDAQRALAAELGRWERVRWRGVRLKRVDRAGFGIYLFAIPWTAFALFWMALASGLGSGFSSGRVVDMLFPLFGVPFVLVGLGMLAKPFLPLLRRGTTVFAVTDKRILRIDIGSTRRMRDIRPADILRVSKTVRRDGSGSIRLRTASLLSRRASAAGTFQLGEARDIDAAGEAITRLAEAADPSGKRAEVSS